MILVLTASPNCHGADPVKLPAVNLGSTAFLDGRAGPGSFLQVTGNWYRAEHFHNSDGDALPGSNKIDVGAFVLQYAYITRFKLLGGYYGAELLLPVVDIQPDTTLPGLPRYGEAGLSDLIVSPFMLQWTDSKLFGRPYFHRLNLIFGVPTGNHNAENDVNPGNNAFRFNPYYAATLLLTPKLSTSVRLHYLWNGKNTDPNPRLHADDIQPGTAFHMNYALSYEVWPKVRLGLAGYYLKQLTEDRIDGVKQPASKAGIFAIGPGLRYRTKGGFFNLNSYFESGATNRPQGYRILVRYAWLF